MEVCRTADQPQWPAEGYLQREPGTAAKLSRRTTEGQGHEMPTLRIDKAANEPGRRQPHRTYHSAVSHSRPLLCVWARFSATDGLDGRSSVRPEIPCKSARGLRSKRSSFHLAANSNGDLVLLHFSVGDRPTLLNNFKPTRPGHHLRCFDDRISRRFFKGVAGCSDNFDLLENGICHFHTSCRLEVSLKPARLGSQFKMSDGVGKGGRLQQPATEFQKAVEMKPNVSDVKLCGLCGSQRQEGMRTERGKSVPTALFFQSAHSLKTDRPSSNPCTHGFHCFVTLLMTMYISHRTHLNWLS